MQVKILGIVHHKNGNYSHATEFIGKDDKTIPVNSRTVYTKSGCDTEIEAERKLTEEELDFYLDEFQAKEMEKDIPVLKKFPTLPLVQHRF